LNAATDLFVPMPTTLKGIKGLNSILRRIDQYREENPDLTIKGFIPTQYDARSAHQASAYRYIQEELPELAPVVTTLRNRPGPYGNAMTQGVPVPLVAPRDSATDELRQVANDLLALMDVKAGVVEHG
jgi:chromosome partitioning protein